MQPTENSLPRRRRVLVVDDEPAFVELMTDVLAGLPVTVSVAGNGREAVEAVRRDAPDVVMLDVNLPVMNGVEALKQIRELDPKLPVLLVTATDYRSVSPGLSAGVFGYLPKPMDVHYVTQLVGLALRSRADDAARAARAR